MKKNSSQENGFIKFITDIRFLFVVVVLFRFLLFCLPSFEIDMTGWRFWAARMVEIGPSQFYSTKVFTDNPPGFLYVFWLIGLFKSIFLPNISYFGSAVFDFLLKLPTNLADLGTGLLIYLIIKRKMANPWPQIGFLAYTLNPAVFFNSSIFGQFDGSGTFFLLLAFYLVLVKTNLVMAAVSFAIAWAIKPQAVALAPVLGLIIIGKIGEIKGTKRRILSGLKTAGAFVLTILAIYWPFFPTNPMAGVMYINDRMTKIFTCTSCFTFNFWGIFGNWQDDLRLFWGLPLVQWGMILLAMSLIPIFFLKPFKLRFKEPYVYLTAAVSILAFFTLLTRMHERYVFPLFAFLGLATILFKNKYLLVFLIFFSLFNTLDQYFPYAYYNKQLNLTPSLLGWLSDNFKMLSFIGFVSFLALLTYFLKIMKTKIRWKETRDEDGGVVKMGKMEEMKGATKEIPVSRREIILVFLLVFVSFLIRVIRLDTPNTYMFDEVYHAFTAVELERGNKMAWEWWNTPPKGFAYEWTHPPLAKEAMIIGIRVIRGIGGIGEKGPAGENPFAWRFPGVLAGVGAIFVLYLIGRTLFSPRVGLIAAFLFSFEGLSFVQSRIGMNDIYFLFFMLLAFYLFAMAKKLAVTNFSVATSAGVKTSLVLDSSLDKNDYQRGKCGSSKIVTRHLLNNYNTYLILMGISLGLSLASKWTAIYGIGVLGGLYVFLGFAKGFSRSLLALARRDLMKLFAFFVLIPVLIYLITYIPFFTSGHTWQQFNELQHQMWWYHTRLKATHPYTSPWFSWPVNFRPVWYYVDYGSTSSPQAGTIANIYGMGNPVIWWAGMAAIGYVLWKLLRSAGQFFSESNREYPSLGIPQKIVRLPAISMEIIKNFVPPRSSWGLILVLFGYFGFFLPWALSPRIMFLYHYLPSVPFMCLALGWGLEKISQIGLIGQIREIRLTGKLLTFAFLLLTFLVFVYFYPHLSGLPVPKELNESYFWFKSWR